MNRIKHNTGRPKFTPLKNTAQQHRTYEDCQNQINYIYIYIYQICGVSETHWTGQGQLESNHYKTFRSGPHKTFKNEQQYWFKRMKHIYTYHSITDNLIKMIVEIQSRHSTVYMRQNRWRSSRNIKINTPFSIHPRRNQ